jgi:DNA-binding MarR family transcriptional regulator/GNAT superfamily N-acetyltransferase
MTHAEVLRRFNRSYTQRIGALADSYLGLGLPLAAARLVWEIGPDGAGVLALRERLDLDSGYLSRLLRELEARGLVRTDPDPQDRRRRRVSLTGSGRRTRQQLEERAAALAEGIIEPLSDRQRDRLTAALREADLLVRVATVRFREVDPADRLASEAVGRYFAELDQRFPGGFDAQVAGQDDRALAAPNGGFVIAVDEGRPVACGGWQRLGPGLAEIKRMWVDPAWRGAGLGARLLRHLEALAGVAGMSTVRLDTNQTLAEAIALYGRAGYRPTARYNDNPYAEAWFEKVL